MNNRIIIFTSIILSSCCLGKNDTYRYVDDNMYPIYKENDTLVYKSNWNNVDTFIYGGLRKYYDCQSNEDHCNTETCYESLLLSYYNINWPDSDSYISCTHEVGTLSKYKYKGFIGGCNDSLQVDSFTIGGIKYENVFYNEVKEFMETNLINSYYSYKQGLLQYEEDNGQIWKLNKTIMK